jgi:succinate dehydrogenase/fumarate reductase iron-sulfur protein
MDNVKHISVKIKRFNPVEDKAPHFDTFEVPLEEGSSVLQVLNYIYEHLDSSLGFYASCRIGKCKGCHVQVNGKGRMACTTIVTGDLMLEPLPKYKVVKDLLVDRD